MGWGTCGSSGLCPLRGRDTFVKSFVTTTSGLHSRRLCLVHIPLLRRKRPALVWRSASARRGVWRSAVRGVRLQPRASSPTLVSAPRRQAARARALGLSRRTARTACAWQLGVRPGFNPAVSERSDAVHDARVPDRCRNGRALPTGVSSCASERMCGSLRLGPFPYDTAWRNVQRAAPRSPAFTGAALEKRTQHGRMD